MTEALGPRKKLLTQCKYLAMELAFSYVLVVAIVVLQRVLGLSFDNVVLQAVQIVAPVLLVVAIAVLSRVLGLPFENVVLLVVQIVALDVVTIPCTMRGAHI